MYFGVLSVFHFTSLQVSSRYVCVYVCMYFFRRARVCVWNVFIYVYIRLCSRVHICICVYVCMCVYVYIYRVSQEERTKLRESVPYVKLYRYNPKHLYPKLNGYGDNGKRSLKL